MDLDVFHAVISAQGVITAVNMNFSSLLNARLSSNLTHFFLVVVVVVVVVVVILQAKVVLYSIGRCVYMYGIRLTICSLSRPAKL